MFLLMLRCGLRISEVAELQLADLYLDEAAAAHGRPRQGLQGALRLPLSPGRAALRAYLAERPPAPSDYVFLSYLGDGMSTTAIHKRLMVYRERAGVHLTAHRLRHRFANDLLTADVPVTSIQKLLGHRWLETTQVYVDANDRQVQDDYYAASGRNWRAGNEPHQESHHRRRALRRRPPPVPRQPAAARLPHAPAHRRLAAGERRPAGALPRVAAQRRRQRPSRPTSSTSPWPATPWASTSSPIPRSTSTPTWSKALDYVKAKRLSDEWTDMCRVALEKFRRFLRQERGLPEAPPGPPDLSRQQAGLPDWLVEQLDALPAPDAAQLAPGPPGRPDPPLLERPRPPVALAGRGARRRSSSHDLRRKYLLDYVDHRLAAGLRRFGHQQRPALSSAAFLRFLQEPGLRGSPGPVPRPQPQAARQPAQVPDRRAGAPAARRDRGPGSAGRHSWPRSATPCSTGRPSTCCGRAACAWARWRSCAWKTWIWPGAGSRAQGQRPARPDGVPDRHRRGGLRAYLAVRGMGPTDHLFLYRNEPLSKDLVRDRIKAAGERVGVKVYPHRLRHTCATQLLNAGCRVTSIQKFLGHKRLNSTMIYARVHDRTVAEDYYAAMEAVEKRLEVGLPPEAGSRRDHR